MRTEVINGNDPIESYLKLKEALAYIRKEGKPVLLEASTSRLYGHSSASGANMNNELDCIVEFGERLKAWGYITDKEIAATFERYELEARQAQEQARTEPVPQPEDVWKYIYANNENADWRKF
jgi:2-oxoisovalerate dehydrogenase E1 component alpha subunit